MVKKSQLTAVEGARLIKRLQNAKAPEEESAEVDRRIAVIGMAGRFPKADSVDTFWEQMLAGTNLVSEIPEDRWSLENFYDPKPGVSDRSNSKWGGFLEGISMFDPMFFGISHREAEAMDPRQRLFLQEAWHALEDAGYADRHLEGLSCGVFVGCEPGDYLQTRRQEEADAYSLTGGGLSILAARIAYILNLKGPALAVDTACSSSLVATTLACDSLHLGHCSMALVGGVSLMTTALTHLSLSRAGTLSPQGLCRSFAAGADGMVPAEAVVAVVLKPMANALADGDQVHGIIKAYGSNQDGRTNGITAPSAPSQAALIQQVYQAEKISPSSIGLIECHGTGTELGDPIEFQALQQVYGQVESQKKSIAIGSAKSNLGHALAASGLVGLIKVILCLKHKKMVPSLHFEKANPLIPFEESPFFVNTTAKPWLVGPKQSRRAALSSFGMSGTNVHLVVEEHTPQKQSISEQPFWIFPISAKSVPALKAMARDLRQWLELNPQVPLGNIAHNLVQRRSIFLFRACMVAQTIGDLIKALSEIHPQRAGKLTQKRRKDANKHLDAWTNEGSQKALQALGTLFCEGFDEALRALYKGEPYQRLSLPGYPFDHEHCWLEELPAPTLPSRLVSGIRPLGFSLLITGDEFYVADHVVEGQKVLPGMVFISLAVKAAELAGISVGQFRNVVWICPLIIQKPTRVFVDLSGQPEGYQFEVFSQNEQDQRILHCEGLIDPQTGIQSPALNLAEIASRTYANTNDFYADFAELGIQYGSGFRVVKTLRGNPNEALAQMVLSENIPGLEAFHFHPALMDGATQAGMGLTEDTPDVCAHLPFSAPHIIMHRPLETPCFAYVTSTRVSHTQRKNQILITDTDGQILLEMKDIYFRALRETPKAAASLELTQEWIPQKLTHFRNIEGPLLVVTRDLGICQGLHASTFIITPANELSRVSECHFNADIVNKQHLGSCLQMIQESGDLPKHIVVWYTAIDPMHTYGTALALTQAFAEKRSNEDMQFMWATQEVNSAAFAALSGCLASFHREMPSFRYKMLHIEPGISPLPILQQEIKEKVAMGCQQVWVGHQRKVLRNIPLTTKKERPHIRRGGVYLITGALGGLGLATAFYLARTYETKLVLIGRRPSDPHTELIEKRLQSTGVQTMYLSADITDRNQCKQIAKRAITRFVEVHGLIHAAGILADAPLINKDLVSAQKVCAPKVDAVDLMAQVFPKLELCVYYSSMAAVTGNAAQSDYAYANRYMDATAHQQNSVGKRIVSIQWSAFSDGGMATPASALQKMREEGLEPLKSEQIGEFLERALASGKPTVMPLQGNRSKLIKMLCEQPDPDTRVTQNLVKKKTVETAKIGDLRARLVSLVAGALKVDATRIETNRPLEDYGVDSFLSLRIIKDMEVDFGPLSKTLLFDHDTIDSLASHLESKTTKPDIHELPRQAAVQAKSEKMLDTGTEITGDAATISWLAGVFGLALKIDPQRLEADVALEDYGVDSFMSLRIIKDLERFFGPLSKTLLFDHETLAQLARWLKKNCGKKLYEILSDSSSPENETVTITEEVPQEDGSRKQPQICRRADLKLWPDLAERFARHLAEGGNESGVARGTGVIAPWLFFTSDGLGCFFFNVRDGIMLVYGYLGIPDSYGKHAGQLLAYAEANDYSLNLLHTSPISQVAEVPFCATPFGVNQRIVDLSNFTMNGRSMRRLRYMVSRFEKAGACKTWEYSNGDDPSLDEGITRLIDRWSASRGQVNPFVAMVRAELLRGDLPNIHRIFLTSVNDQLVNAIIISKVDAIQGYLMDLEFYGPEMPMGGLEYAVSKIIPILASEGATTFSLGGTFGPKVGDSPCVDTAMESILDGLRESHDMGAGNYQFKRKFRPEEETIYLCRPKGTLPETVTDIFLMIADPGNEDVPIHVGNVHSGKDAASLGIMPDSHQRLRALEACNFDMAPLPSDAIVVDLYTDSWGQLNTDFVADRSAILSSLPQTKTEPAILLGEGLGFPHVLITVSGRTGEAAFCKAYPHPGPIAIAPLFPTMISHLIEEGFIPEEYRHPAACDPSSTEIFKGDLDLTRLKEDIVCSDFVAVVVETCNNAVGGSPVSLAHLKALRLLADQHGLDIILDITRIMENAYLIQRHEPGYHNWDVWQITRALCENAHHLTGSLCKDFGVTIGGLVSTRDPSLFKRVQEKARILDVLPEKKVSELLARALQDRDYIVNSVRARLDAVTYLREKLKDAGLPVFCGIGGHCVLLDTALAPDPQSFLAWLFEHSGIRAGLHCSGMFRNHRLGQAVRLAVPTGMPFSSVEVAARNLSEAWHRLPPLFPLLKKPESAKNERSYVRAQAPIELRDNKHAEKNVHLKEPIAIIGLAGRYPQSKNLDAFWENLRSGKDCITSMSEERRSLLGIDAADSHQGGYLENVDLFDAAFFGISAQDALKMDPQERLFMEAAWHGLENAGVVIDGTTPIPCGVFVGAVWSHYQAYGLKDHSLTPNSFHWRIANHVSHTFHLTGPSMALDTACASSLSAVHQACHSLNAGACDIALAGGVNLELHPYKHHLLRSNKQLSDDGRCRTFGDGGSGYGAGEGVGVAVLKHLSRAQDDGNPIYGIIRSSVCNHSGRTSQFTIPSPHAQASLLADGLAQSGIDPQTLGYVEAHGVGTAMGDAIEMEALNSVYSTILPKESVPIASVKSVVGHLEAAAGICALTKVLLQMRHGYITPSLHATPPNSFIDFEASPFVVNRAIKPWPSVEKAGKQPQRRALVNAFGAGGTSVHLVLEEGPQPAKCEMPLEPQIVVLSARTKRAVKELVNTYLTFIQKNPELSLAAFAHTTRCGRVAFEHRVAILANNLEGLGISLKDFLVDKSNSSVWIGNTEKPLSDLDLLEGPEGEAFLQALYIERNQEKIAQMWCGGLNVDWSRLYTGKAPQLLALPGYPFLGQPYWPNISMQEKGGGSSQLEASITPLQEKGFFPHRHDLPVESNVKSDSLEIAIVGLSGRYPHSPDLQSLWENLLEGRDCRVQTPEKRQKLFGLHETKNTHSAGYLDGVADFDATFFGISEEAAMKMDPQERLFVETVYQTLEDASYITGTSATKAVGVFVGAVWSQYQIYGFEGGDLAPNSFHWSIANHVSHLFDFKGPSLAVDTACASSLSALQLACEAIGNGECELAIAGGVNLELHPYKHQLLHCNQKLSEDGRCRAFGEEGKGYGLGEGIGAALLQPLTDAQRDGRHIWGVIRAVASNHTGRTSNFTAPCSKAQASLMKRVLQQSGVDPQTIGYVEAHGIGTTMRDGIEIQALCDVYTPLMAQNSVPIGSIKSNIGHLEAAAGIASLTKVLLQMKHEQFVPSLHTTPSNPSLDFEATPFYVNQKLQPWLPSDNSPRRALINGFGTGGTSVHLVVEEGPRLQKMEIGQKPELVVLSAKTLNALHAMVQRYIKFLQTSPADLNLSDLAFTTRVGRPAYGYRLAILASSLLELKERMIQYQTGEKVQTLWHGESKTDPYNELLKGAEGEAFINALYKNRNLPKLARLWVGGYSLAWERITPDPLPNRVSLPVYPFQGTTYWPTSFAPKAEAAASMNPEIVSNAWNPPGEDPDKSPLQDLAGIWAEVLGVEAVRETDNFFQLGGHSIQVVQVIARVAQHYGLSISPVTFFRSPTLAAFASELETMEPGEKQDIIPPHTLEQITDDRGNTVEVAPLSFAQQRLWFLDRLDEKAGFNMVMVYQIDGPLDVRNIAKVTKHIMTHHAPLRAYFPERDGQPYQAFRTTWSEAVQLIDLSSQGWDPQQKEVVALVKALSEVPFALQTGPLLRLRLVRLNAQCHILTLVQHHICGDGWSLGLMMGEITAHYSASIQGNQLPKPDLTITYADYAAWQRERLQGAYLENQLAFWQKQLEAMPAQLEIPTDRPRGAQVSSQGDTISLHVPENLLHQLQNLSNEHGATLFMTLMATYHILLARYSGQNDIAIGSPVANRPKRELEPLIGMFMNALVIRNRSHGDPGFSKLLTTVRDTASACFAHQDIPFEQLAEVMDVDRNLSGDLWFQVMLVLQSGPGDPFTLPGTRCDFYPATPTVAKLDLLLDFYPTDQGLVGRLEYRTDLFDRSTVTRMMRHYCNLLNAVVEAPHTAISRLPILGKDEQREMLVTWNKHTHAFPTHQCLHHLFEEAAARCGSRTAVVLGGGSEPGRPQGYSFAELNQHANDLAAELAAHGAGPEVPVGIYVERCPELFVAILAVLKAGATYVPLDPDYPSQRLSYMVENAHMPLLVTRYALKENVPPSLARVLYVDAQRPIYAHGNFKSRVHRENLAYIIYSSGSTGNPKGIAISHESVVSMCYGWKAAYDIEDNPAGHTQMASFSFDVFIGETSRTWMAGAKLVVIPKDFKMDPARLYACMVEEKVEFAEFVPAVLKLLLAYLDTHGGHLHFLRMIPAGADSWTVQTWQHLARYTGPNTRFCNSYGVTEVAVDNTYFEGSVDHLSPERVLPIGKPYAGDTLYVLDAQLQPVPIGVYGVLYIGGPGVGRGYYQQASKTAEKFIPDPFMGLGQRMYCTNDSVRYFPDGNLEFQGRVDHQVKLRGFRIELGEIEGVLSGLPDIAEAVVNICNDGRGLGEGSKHLVAYVGSHKRWEIDLLREALTDRLPDYMVPVYFIFMDRLPTTPNGKLDRKNLPEPDYSGRQTVFVAPRNALEMDMAAIWSEVLEADSLGIHDNFFDLGGHSLLVTKVISRLRNDLQLSLSIRDFFNHPTIALLADACNREAMDLPPLRPGSRETHPEGALAPMSLAQERLWVFDLFNPGTAVYIISGAIPVEGRIDIPKLEQALELLTERHESLRTRFEEVDGDGFQLILPHWTPTLKQMELNHLEEAEAEAAALEAARQDACKPISLTAAPVWHMSLYTLAAEKAILSLHIHHILADGLSLRVFFGDLLAIYANLLQSQALELNPMPFQYADYTVWQRELPENIHDEDLTWWAQRLEGVPTLNLPTDYVRPQKPTFKGAIVPFGFPEELASAVFVAARKNEVTPFMLLNGIFVSLLSRYANQTDVVIGMPVSGRHMQEQEPMIGFFIDVLALRTDHSNQPNLHQLCTHMKTVILDAFAHEQLPFQKLVEHLKPMQDTSRNPIFQVVCQLLKQPAKMTAGGLTLRPNFTDWGISRFDMGFDIVQTEERLDGYLEFSTDLWDRATIEAFSSHYLQLLSAALTDPTTPLCALPILSETERVFLIETLNQTSSGHRSSQTLIACFASQVALHGSNIATLEGGHYTSYHQLSQRANAVAAYLLERGVSPGDAVAICHRRSTALLAGMLGILQAGAFYVPLDPDYPLERQEYILGNSGAQLVLVEDGLLHRSRKYVQHLSLQAALVTPARPVSPQLSPSQPAYAMYTSGSTGQPKGILVSHANVLRLALNQRHARTTPGDTWLFLASISFDASTLEIWSALLNGARLGIMDEGDLTRLGDAIKQYEVTILHLTAQLFHMMVDDHLESLEDIQQLLTGGEAVSAVHARQFMERYPNKRLIHCYGPTENTTFTTTAWLDKVGTEVSSCPIGEPITETTVYVTDNALRLVPNRVHGELVTGGSGLAYGYLDDPARTAACFVPDPFGAAAGGRLYRTGDLAYRNRQNQLFFAGRMDHQVKVRGYRIEPGEVAHHLAALPRVTDALIRPFPSPDGSTILCGYVQIPDLADTDTNLSASLRLALSQHLPDYMVPAVILCMSELPLNANGKVDTSQLPEPVLTQEQELFIPLTDPVQEALARVWQSFFPASKIGAHSDFFILGGHSLLATRIAVAIEHEFGIQLPLASIFKHKQLADCAALITALMGQGNCKSRTIDVCWRTGESYPFHTVTSSAQDRLWFIDRMQPDNATYNISSIYRIEGRIHTTALSTALGKLIDRHESLRTSFGDHKGTPFQRIEKTVALPLQVTDLRNDTHAAMNRANAIQVQVAQPFDLSAAPLFRVHLLQEGDRDTLLVCMHHIISDAWSLNLFMRELLTFYDAELDHLANPLPSEFCQYADYAHYQRGKMEGGAFKVALDWWCAHLEGVTNLELPTDFPRPQVVDYRGDAVTFQIPKNIALKLKFFNLKHNTTAFMTLLAALQVLLSRYSGGEDIAVGSPIANRNRSEWEKIIGFFVNSLVMRNNLAEAACFASYVEEVQATSLAAYDHQDVPFDRVVEALGVNRDPARHPLFQVMFQVLHAEAYDVSSRHLRLLPEIGKTQFAHFDISLSLLEGPDGLTGQFIFATSLFRRATIEQMGQHYCHLLEQLLDEPDRPLMSHNLCLLPDKEAFRNIQQWPPEPKPQGLYGRFLSQVSERGVAIALLDGERQMTYAELADAANCLAAHLKRSGVQLGDPVLLCLPRSIDAVIGILAIVGAGAFYVPLDHNYPQSRISFMKEDTGAKVLITRHGLLSDLIEGQTFYMEDLPQLPQAPAPQYQEFGLQQAYVIYTSGSTGRPKGVVVNHRAVIRLVCDVSYVNLGPDAIMMLQASISFDASTWEVWGALLNGARLVVMSSNDLYTLPQLVEEHKVTHMFLTTQLFHLVVDDLLDAFGSVEQLLAGGEVVSTDHIGRFLETWPNNQLFNAYGPTENTTFTTVGDLGDLGIQPFGAPIGKPIDQTTVAIVDRHFNHQPVNIRGELVTGGVGVAQCYLGKPALTAEKFVPNPFASEPGERLYRTGDLSRLLPGGFYEFSGRIDQQVKVRGFRIEPREIAVMLTQHGRVSDAVISVFDDAGGAKMLVGYAQISDLGDGEAELASELRTFLQENLPQYMVPTLVMCVPAFPLKANGKVDRARLPQPEYMQETYQAPETPEEIAIAEIWAEVLGVERVGRRDDFFNLGGHSLLAIRVISAINHKLGYRQTVASLFRNSCLHDFANQLGEVEEGILVTLRAAEKGLPWFLIHPGGGEVHHYLPLAQHLAPGPVYGLQHPGLNDPEERGLDLTDLALRYNQKIRSIQPYGPYLLAGWSLGGGLAFEMARYLDADGQRCEVVLIDSIRVSTQKLFGEERLLKVFDTFLGDLQGQGSLDPKIREKLHEGATDSGDVEGTLQSQAAHLLPLWNVQWAFFQASVPYKPATPLDRGVTLLRSDEGRKLHKKRCFNWSTMAPNLKIHNLSGDHYSIVREGEVEALAIHLNRIAEPIKRAGSSWSTKELLTAQDIVAIAQTRCGTDLIPDPAVLDGLEKLVEEHHASSYRKNNSSHFFNRTCVFHMCQHLELKAYVAADPKIEEIPVERPLVIGGMPRTGTTLLQRLLALDPAARSPLYWETRKPYPSPRKRTMAVDPRLYVSQTELAQVYEECPRMKAIHHMVADQPDECDAFLANAMHMPVIAAGHQLLDYQFWTYERDLVPAYRFHKQQLQILSQHYRPGHWLLKSPMHVSNWLALRTVYPDANLVNTHRHPKFSIPSLCSLVSCLQEINDITVDPKALGAFSLKLMTFLMDKAIDAREQMDEGVLDVGFAELMEDPIGLVRKIYGHFYYAYTPGFERRMKRWLKENQRHKEGKHTYSLEQFGLSEALVEDGFTRYLDRFTAHLECSL